MTEKRNVWKETAMAGEMEIEELRQKLGMALNDVTKEKNLGDEYQRQAYRLDLELNEANLTIKNLRDLLVEIQKTEAKHRKTLDAIEALLA
jgi:hypothetical protein